MKREDLRIESTWYGLGRGTILKLIHLPTGLSVQETKTDLQTPTLKRLEKLTSELAALVEASEPKPE
jgi:hypothetical protein